MLPTTFAKIMRTIQQLTRPIVDRSDTLSHQSNMLEDSPVTESTNHTTLRLNGSIVYKWPLPRSATKSKRESLMHRLIRWEMMHAPQFTHLILYSPLLPGQLATTILPSLMWISFSDQWVHGHYIQPWYYVIIWWAVDLERGALNHIVLVPSALPVSCRMHGCLQIGARSKHHRSFHCLSSLTLFIHLFETIVNGRRHRLDHNDAYPI